MKLISFPAYAFPPPCPTAWCAQLVLNQNNTLLLSGNASLDLGRSTLRAVESNWILVTGGSALALDRSRLNLTDWFTLCVRVHLDPSQLRCAAPPLTRHEQRTVALCAQAGGGQLAQRVALCAGHPQLHHGLEPLPGRADGRHVPQPRARCVLPAPPPCCRPPCTSSLTDVALTHRPLLRHSSGPAHATRSAPRA